MVRYGLSALDLFAAERTGGVANYTWNLAAALADLITTSDDPARQLTVYVRADYHGLDAIESTRVRLHRLPLPSRPRGVQFASRVLAEQLALAPLAARDQLNLLHSPNHVIPLLRRTQCPATLTVHDLTFYSHPQTHAARTRIYMQTLVPASVRHAVHIMCDSQSTANDLLARFPHAAGKTEVVMLAAAASYRTLPADEVAATLARHNLAAGRYFLYLGTLEPRKNVAAILDAYAQLSDQLDGIPLIIAGKVGRYSQTLLDQPAALGIADRVRFLGYVDTADAVALYNGALAVVYPSLYEGFGLPILEAMACGAPVITANSSSMPEVAGDAALLVNPHDPSSIAHAMHLVATQPALRAAMIARGRAQAAQFSWQRTAQQVLQSWENLVQHRTSS